MMQPYHIPFGWISSLFPCKSTPGNSPRFGCKLLMFKLKPVIECLFEVYVALILDAFSFAFSSQPIVFHKLDMFGCHTFACFTVHA